jgi:zinc transport system ATP-binding protein
VIEIEDLRFSFDNGGPVLEDVSLAVAAQEFVTIIGPNGGGKTTLLKLMLGLLQPSAGRLRVLGTSPERARPRIGYMPQLATLDPRFPVRVLDVVLMGRLGPNRQVGAPSGEDRRAAMTALARVGMTDLARRTFSALSGGQRQRALLARALACDPELLLLDEPAAGLDQKMEQDFSALLGELTRSKTVVLVSHDLGFVSEIVDTVVCVRRTVSCHPMAALDGTMIKELYGGEVRLVRHDHSH